MHQDAPDAPDAPDAGNLHQQDSGNGTNPAMSATKDGGGVGCGGEDHLVAVHGAHLVGFVAKRLVDALIHVPEATLVVVGLNSAAVRILRRRRGGHDRERGAGWWIARSPNRFSCRSLRRSGLARRGLFVARCWCRAALECGWWRRGFIRRGQ